MVRIYYIIFRFECFLGLVRMIIINNFRLKIGYILRPNKILVRGRLNVENRVRIQKYARIEIGLNGKLTLDQDCSIGHNFHCIAHADMLIGSGTLISGNVFIGDLEHGYETGKSPSATSVTIKGITIGRNCFIGTGSVILPGTQLGDDCVVAAGAVVKGYFPDGSLIAGVPGKIKPINIAVCP